MIRHLLLILALSMGCLVSSARAENAIPTMSSGTPAESATGKKVKLLPLPIYATDPSEGPTYGLMPVFLIIDQPTQHTDSIYAPSVSWNKIIGETGTFRWFNYPGLYKSLTFTASVSTHVNWGGILVWENEEPKLGEFTETAFVRWQRSIFFRFFGLGPDTGEENQTSHTRIRGDVWYRRGINVAPYTNVGLKLEARKDVVQSQTAPGYPSSPYVFAGAPGMGGGNAFNQLLDIRLDTRPNRDYSLTGQFMDVSFGPGESPGYSPAYVTGTIDARELFQETSGISSAARFYAQYVSSPQVPFYYQSSLGGSFLMRGLIDDRFVDQGAWTAEFEQRFRVLQSHIYGVTTDWRLDPFVAVGQVFRPGTGLVSKLRVAEGIGFRAWVHPNVLGRVDMAAAREGVNFYVELGYPY